MIVKSTMRFVRRLVVLKELGTTLVLLLLSLVVKSLSVEIALKGSLLVKSGLHFPLEL